MTKTLLSFASLLTAATVASASNVTPFDGESFDFSAPKRAHEWVKTSGKKSSVDSRRKAVVSNPDTKIGPASIYGTLNSPDGTTWFYTAEYTEGEKGYNHAKLVIYDENREQIGVIEDDMELAENETSVNQIEINPTITRQFFNSSSSDFEVMLFIHATTTDYTGHFYNHVFSVDDSGNASLIQTIEGNEIIAKNISTNSWSENYIMVFEVDDNYVGEYTFNVYGKKTYNSNGPELKHTFKASYDLTSSMGEYGLPILMTVNDGQPYYTLAHYEIPYFDPDVSIFEDAVVQENNNLVVEIYDSSFELKTTTKIPVPTDKAELGDYLYIFPIIGGLNYNDDVVFNEDGTTSLIITYENYTTDDDYIDSFYSYDIEGNRLGVIYEDASAALYLSDVTNYESQFCFWHEGETDDDNYFSFVNYPSCEELFRIPVTYEGTALSSNLDRVAVGRSYNIVVSSSGGIVQSDDSVTADILWFDEDGNLDHTDTINMGQDVAYAQFYISAKALTPYLVNTDEAREYFTLVKTYVKSGSTETEEHLIIFNENSERLLEFAPNDDGHLSNISLFNTATNSPSMLATYVDDDYNVTLTFTDFPLTKFAEGGDGTASNPYLISTAGDFLQIANSPAANYRLVNDIDFNGSVFSTIDSFTGNIDGDNHLVKNMIVSGNGLFDSMSGATSVSNIVFVDPEVTDISYTAGLIASQAMGTTSTNAPSFSNIKVYGLSINSDDNVGGLVGTLASYSSINDCYVYNATISAPNSAVGGMVYDMRTSASVKNSTFTGTIEGKENVGGIAAKASIGDESISNCHVDAEITGDATIGGILGYSKRATIANCVAEGTFTANNAETPSLGGVVGYLEGTYSASAPIITGNIVAANIVTADDADKSTAHRIAGYTSVNDSEIDWNNEDFDWDNFDWSDMSLLPRISGDVEAGLANNYAYNSAAVDSSVEATATSTEGADIDALTTDALTEIGYLFGNSSDAPWKLATTPALYFEDVVISLTVNKSELSFKVGESKKIEFTVVGCDPDNISIAIEGEGIEFTSSESEGCILTVELTCIAEGSATVTATVGDLTATCNVFGLSGINTVATDEVDNSNAPVEYYNLQGVRIANPQTGLYIRRQGNKAEKVIIR
jgi:hypothetical protein